LGENASDAGDARTGIDSQANFFVGGRIGVKLFDPDAIMPDL
jgi:hypothetical protein